MQNIVTNEISSWGNFKGHSTLSHDHEKKILEGDTVVVDHATGLMWAQFSDCKESRLWVTYTIAFKTNHTTYAGFCDWRLPTLEEAASLLEEQVMNDGLKISKIFDILQHKIWTRDSYVKGNSDLLGDDIQVWQVDFRASGHNFTHWDRGRAEACICLVRSSLSPAQSFDPYGALELFAADLLGRDVNAQEYDIIHYTDIEAEINDDGGIFLLATHPPAMVENSFKSQIRVLQKRLTVSIKMHSEKFDKTTGRPLSELETARLCQLEKFMALDEIFERIFAAANPEGALEIEMASLRKPYVPLRFEYMQHMNKKNLSGQSWAFYPVGRAVLLVYDDMRGIEERALRFWESFEELNPLVVQKLNEVLPKQAEDKWGHDYYNHLDAFYFYGEYEGSQGIDFCFKLGLQGILVGIKEGEIAYVDEYEVKDYYPRKRLWGKVAEPTPKRKSAGLLKAEQKWKIERITIRTRDSYFESDVQYEFRVTNKKTGEIFATYSRSEYSDDRGDVDRGCRSVKFSEDCKSIIVIDEDGTEDIKKLPD